MKQFILVLIAGLAVLGSCKKHEYLGGDGCIAGEVIYTDSTGDHAAKNVTIMLYSDSGNGYKKLFEFISADGKFRLESLPEGNYQLKASYLTGGKLYEGEKKVELDEEIFEEYKLILTKVPGVQSHMLTGNVKYDNLLSEHAMAAEGATVELIDASGEAIAATTVLGDGSYELSVTITGNYTLVSKLSTSPDGAGQAVVYSKTIPVTITSAEEIHQDVLLVWDAAGTILRIHVTDSLQNPLPNSAVCIYSNPNFMTANNYSCNGSERSAATNQQGNVLLSGLSGIRYYISSTKSVGTVALYSDSLESTLIELVPGVVNVRGVELREGW